MRLGLFLSFTMHALVLFWALVGIAATKPLPEPPKPEPVVAEIITPGELNKLRKGSRTAKLDDGQPKDSPAAKEPPKEAPKPKPVTAEPPPPPPEPIEEKPPPPEPPKAAEAPPPPPPAPKAAEQPDKESLDKKLEELALEKAAEDQRKAEEAARAKAAAEAKAKAEAEAKARAEAEAKRKAEEKKKREIAEAKRKEQEKKKREAEAKARAEADAKSKSKLDSDRLAALLDKSPDQRPPPPAAPEPAAPTKARGPVRGDRSGRDSANSANERSMLLGMIVSKVKACWNIQAGGEHTAGQAPEIEFYLNPDGSLRGEPRVLNDQNSPQFRLAVDAAKSAIIRCQRYDLPPDKYHMWQRVTLDFDPREMFQ